MGVKKSIISFCTILGFPAPLPTSFNFVHASHMYKHMDISGHIAAAPVPLDAILGPLICPSRRTRHRPNLN